ncbi:hypothetical protein NM208_g6456 [Fusarium decemcellulare]|uniref:Uncharacterized protein n=1 Tax=Fusarium decemcellulare TaxID=57161 RepID=A0ACC1SCY0_9HYPO|nr:hypothetical protein NM208_g6456 [Fusarium decemcellulare]
MATRSLKKADAILSLVVVDEMVDSDEGDAPIIHDISDQVCPTYLLFQWSSVLPDLLLTMEKGSKNVKGKGPGVTVDTRQSQASPGTVGGNTFSARFNKAIIELDNLRRDHEGIKEYEALYNEQATKTKSQLEAKIDQLEKAEVYLTHKYEQRCKVFGDAEKQLRDDRGELDKLRKTVKAAQEAAGSAEKNNRDLRSKVEERGDEANKLQQSLATLEEAHSFQALRLEKKLRELQTCRETLEQVRDDLGLLPLDQDATKRAFEKLANRFHELVWDYFDTSPPGNDEVVVLSVNSPALSRIPQGTSASQAARSIRCAFAEAVITQELVASIFCDLYMIEATAQLNLNGLALALEGLGRAHALQAAIIRCQLGLISEKSAKVKEIPTRAAVAVTQVLCPWICNTQQEERFEEELKKLFIEALKLWQDLQRTRQPARAVVDIVPDLWVPEEDCRSKYGDMTSSETEGQRTSPSLALDVPIAILFPQIYVGNDFEAGKGPLFHGFALFPAQQAVMAASMERAPSPYTRRRASDKRRTSDHKRRNTLLEQPARDGLLNGVSGDQHHY